MVHSEAHVSLITLGVDDLARATAFYTALGWRRSSASVEGTVTFLHGVPVLALFGRADLAAEAGLPPGAAPAAAGFALAMNLPSPEAVDRAMARAGAAGARITKPAEQAPWGGYSGYFLDPDGHLWEIACNPSFGLGDDGAIELPDAG